MNVEEMLTWVLGFAMTVNLLQMFFLIGSEIYQYTAMRKERKRQRLLAKKLAVRSLLYKLGIKGKRKHYDWF